MPIEDKHVQFALLDDHEDIEPLFRLRTFPCAFPVLLATKHALLRPGRTQECEFLIRNANVCRSAILAPNASIVVLLSFSDNSVRQIRCEAKRRSEERAARPEMLIKVGSKLV